MKRFILLIFCIIFTCQIPVFANTAILNNAALSSPGSSHSDWSAIALAVSGVDFNKELYINSLKDYVLEKYATPTLLSSNKSTEWHRIALAVNLLGYNPTDFFGINLINDGVFYRENLGKQGLNGYIWALITISSIDCIAPEDAVNTKESIIQAIVSSQNSDGSFSLRGNTPDCDITSMAVYALSHYKDRADVSYAIDNALNYLFSIKNPDGTFSSGEISNSESTAQVIIALSALKIINTDSRFSDVYDGLMLFKTDNGFSHIQGGESDIIATAQACCAIASLKIDGGVYIPRSSPKPIVKKAQEKSAITVEPTEYVAPSETEIETETEMETETETETYVVTENNTENADNLVTKDTDGNEILIIIPIIFFVFTAFYVIIRRRK